MQEKQIEKKLIEAVRKVGGRCYKFNSQSNNGMPDRICIFPNGKILFVELKRPKGGLLSPIQKEQHRRLRELKQDVITVWDLDDIEKVVDFGV